MPDVINVTHFCAAHYAALAVFLFLSYLWGGILLHPLLPDRTESRFFLNTAAGLGSLIVLLFYAALASLLYPAAVACLLCLAPAYIIYSKDYSVITPRISGVDNTTWRFATAAAALLLAPIMLPPLYPPTMWDEISYHLPYARFYVESNGLAVNSFLRYPLYSHNIDLLYSLSLLFYDDILAHLFHASAAMLTGVGIYQLGKDTHSRTAGTLAASIFLSSPAVLLMMRTSYIDLGLTLFVFLAFFCIGKWSLSREERWLYVAGFAAGIALGSKYSGFLYLALLTLWMMADARKCGPVLKFIVPALVFGSPWYIRNFLISGDPLSPFGGNTFGFWLWNKQDLIAQGKDLLVVHGTPRTFMSFLKLPWNLVFHAELFMKEGVSPGVLALFPSFLMLRRLSPFYRKVALYVLVNLLLWFYSTQIVRYLLPTLPMIALLSSVSLLKLCEVCIQRPLAALSGSRAPLFLSKAAAYVPLLIAAAPFLVIDAYIVGSAVKNPLPVTESMRDSYLAQKIPSYALLQLANERPDMPIYQLGFENSFYFAKGRMMGDWFGPARYSTITGHLSDPAKLYAALKSTQAKFFLFNKKRFFVFNYDPRYRPFLTKIAETEDAALFEIK